MLKPDVLRYQKDFDRLFGKGKSYGSRHLVQIVLKNELGYNRFAVIASKKVGGSVQRNRARRLIKESLRLYKDDISKSYDILFIARKEIDKVSCGEVADSMKRTLKKSGLLI